MMNKGISNPVKSEPTADTVMDKTMNFRQYLGDAMTAVSINIIVNITGIIIYFYTDIIGLDAGMVGAVLLVSRLIDAFSDIGMGHIVDRTNSKHGKARIWLLRMALPSLVCIVLLFTVPSGAGAGLKVSYIAVTYTLMLAVVYTAIAVPSGSLMSLETKSSGERAKMGILRLAFAYAAGMSVSSLMIPAANRLGGGQNAWIIMSVIYGAVSAGSLVVVFFCVKETNVVQLREKEKVSLFNGIKFLLKNKYWVIALAVNVLIQTIYAMGGAGTYYMKYILGDENLVAVAGLYRLIFVTVGIVLSEPLIRRFGKKNMILAGVVFCIAGCVLRAVNPYHLTLNMVAIGITTLGGVPMLGVIGAMVADTIEYGEWKTGVRTVGLASSANSFAGKLGSALSSGSIGWLLGMSGYSGILAMQPDTANRMIMILNIHVPLAGYGIVFVLMLFYNLDKDYDRIISELQARRKN